MQRRDFLKVLAGAAVSTQLTSCAWGNQVRFISAHNDPERPALYCRYRCSGKKTVFSIYCFARSWNDG